MRAQTISDKQGVSAKSVWKQRLLEGHKVAEELLASAGSLHDSSRIEVLRMRFQLLARVQEMEDQLNQFQALPRDSRDSMRSALEKARSALESLLQDLKRRRQAH